MDLVPQQVEEGLDRGDGGQGEAVLALPEVLGHTRPNTGRGDLVQDALSAAPGTQTQHATLVVLYELVS